MFEQIFRKRCHIECHRNGPCTEERVRYLIHLQEEGRTPKEVRRVGQSLTRHGIHEMLRTHVRKASASCPSLLRKRISPHTIRHTTATHLLRSGVDINTIRAWLGHVSIDTTNIYAEVDLERKAQMLAQCASLEPAAKRRTHWRSDPSLMAFLRAL